MPGGVNAELLESELFGHVKGAFTGANAARAGLLERVDHGTLLLDNVEQLAPELQPRLLRFLEACTVQRVGGGAPRTVDVRVLATAQQPLESAVEQGRLRADLYYRLAGVVLDVPSLQQRRDDIPGLCALFLAEAGAKLELTAATLAALQAHPWPGQARELRHAVERAVAFGRFEQTPETKAAAPSPADAGLIEARGKVAQAFEADVLRAPMAEEPAGSPALRALFQQAKAAVFPAGTVRLTRRESGEDTLLVQVINPWRLSLVATWHQVRPTDSARALPLQGAQVVAALGFRATPRWRRGASSAAWGSRASSSGRSCCSPSNGHPSTCSDGRGDATGPFGGPLLIMLLL